MSREREETWSKIVDSIARKIVQQQFAPEILDDYASMEVIPHSYFYGIQWINKDNAIDEFKDALMDTLADMIWDYLQDNALEDEWDEGRAEDVADQLFDDAVQATLTDFDFEGYVVPEKYACNVYISRWSYDSGRIARSFFDDYELAGDEVREAIESGKLDEMLQTIARDCVETYIAKEAEEDLLEKLSNAREDVIFEAELLDPYDDNGVIEEVECWVRDVLEDEE